MIQLSENDRARISEAIRMAEAQTSGEIYCVISRACSDYRLVPLAWAALIGLIAPLPLIYLTQWPATVIYMMQLLAFVFAFFCLSHQRLRFLIVPSRAKRDRAHAEAVHQFAAHGLQNTEARTGVLIFVSLAERYAEILADAGIDQKVEPSTWEEAVGTLTASIRQGQLADGFVGAIEQCTKVLAANFPPGALNRNELPDAIIEL